MRGGPFRGDVAEWATDDDCVLASLGSSSGQRLLLLPNVGSASSSMTRVTPSGVGGAAGAICFLEERRADVDREVLILAMAFFSSIIMD